MNDTLESIARQDQQDRSDPTPTAEQLADIAERDRLRRREVQRLIDDGALETGADFYNAALIFHHGATTADFKQAHTLATKAHELGHEKALSLVAVSLDRFLVSQGLPQKFGTQYPGGILAPVDPNTTDEERATYGFPPLDQIPTTWEM